MMAAKPLLLHAIIIGLAIVTLLPFAFALNNSFRTNTEIYHGFFGIPHAFTGFVAAARAIAAGQEEPIVAVRSDRSELLLSPGEALRFHGSTAFASYRQAWQAIRPFMVNTLLVCFMTAGAVLMFSSLTAYVLSRHRFWGARTLYYFIIATMMFPAVLTFVPGFLLVKSLGLLNTYWAMVLPYTASGQAFAVFVLKAFFDSLPEELFEASRLDGAGHRHTYWHIVLPLSKPVLSVILVVSVVGTWNEFMWPFVTQPDGRNHVIASGLFVLATSSAQTGNAATLFAAYMLSSIPLLMLFAFATRPFVRGVTTGTLKA